MRHMKSKYTRTLTSYLSGQCHHLALSRKNNKKQYFQVEFEFKSKIPKMFSTTDKIPSKNF